MDENADVSRQTLDDDRRRFDGRLEFRNRTGDDCAIVWTALPDRLNAERVRTPLVQRWTVRGNRRRVRSLFTELVTTLLLTRGGTVDKQNRKIRSFRVGFNRGILGPFNDVRDSFRPKVERVRNNITDHRMRKARGRL